MNITTATEEDVRIVKSMRREESDELKRLILQADPTDIFTAAANKESKPDKRYIICPCCGNGSGKDKTPVEVSFKGDKWLYHCFACQEFSGDLLSIIAKEHHLSLSNRDDMICALAVGANLIGYSLFLQDFKDQSKRPKKILAPVKDTAPETFAPFTRLEESRNNLPTFFRSHKTFRGLTQDTLSRLKWGFLQDFSHPSDKDRKWVFPAIIIPNDKGGLLARAVNSTGQWSGKSNVSPAATTTVNLPTDNNLLFVVEGAIDAASIAQATSFKFGVIAIGGLSGIDSFLNYITELYPADKPKPKIIVMLDNDSDVPEDNRGQIGAKKLLAELLKRGFVAINRVITNQPRIDANIFLKQYGDFTLANTISSVLQNSDDDFADAEKSVAALNFEGNPAVEKISADSPAVESNDDFVDDVAQWEEHNGKINPDTLSKLKKAKAYLDGLTSKNMTSAAAQSSKTKHALAMCKFYDCFSASADKFLAELEYAKKKATAAIKKSEALNTDEPPIELQMLLQVSVRDLKAAVEKIITVYKKKHKDFRQAEEYRLAKELAERKRAERDALFKSNLERLHELEAMPRTPVRDLEIIEVIKDMCEWRHDKYGNPVEVKATAANLKLIFEHDPYLKSLFGFDEFQGAPVFLRQAIWRKDPCSKKEWTDFDDSELRVYLRETYTELANKDLIFDYFTSYANRNSFHEIKDYFHNLPQWDGVSRAETFFIDWLKVADTPFAREVTIKWLLAAIARIFNPGCSFQWALVLHGAQQIGKGFTLERIGGKWYIAIGDRVDDSHAVDTIKNCWIGEFKEMSGMRKSDVNAIKSFIELPADTRRFAYQRRATTVQRHCVFAVTVNDDNFLADLTGNRRFLILHSELPKFGYVKEVRGESLKDDNVIAQIWAEVFHLYNELFADGFDDSKLELSAVAKQQGEEIANQYLRDDDVIGIVSNFLEIKTPTPVIWNQFTKEERRSFFTNGSFAIELEDLQYRFKNYIQGKRFADKLKEEFDAACEESSTVRHEFFKNKLGKEAWHLTFYGSELRDHVCAAEIIAECFDKGDRRISSGKANEVLNKIDGWLEGKRLQKTDPHYSDQKRVFYRNRSVAIAA